MSYKYILFDLDGTIIDSQPGVVKAAEFALNKMGVPQTQIADLDRFIGPPLKFSFKSFYSFSDEFADKAVEYFREYYRDKGILDCTVYEGMVPLLQMLIQKGFYIALATSKPVVFARRILERFEIIDYFDAIAGANMDDSRSDKSELILQACEELGARDLSQVVMIGDTKYDIEVAVKLDIDSIGVLYGFSTLEDFQKAGATYVVNTVAELAHLLISLSEDEK